MTFFFFIYFLNEEKLTLVIWGMIKKKTLWEIKGNIIYTYVTNKTVGVRVQYWLPLFTELR